MEVLQLLVSGLANGCVYGLIALGFVLIPIGTKIIAPIWRNLFGGKKAASH